MDPSHGELGSDTTSAAELRDAVRVANLAEAGYLVSLLQAEGLEAIVCEDRQFDAASGFWRVDYVLRAPADQLHKVAHALRDEAEAINREPDRLADEQQDPLQRVLWPPAALLTLAGVVSFLAGQHLGADSRPTAPGMLGDTVAGIGQPFYTEPTPDGVRRRLQFDSRQREWLLDTDTDGDGRFDRRSRFAAPPAK